MEFERELSLRLEDYMDRGFLLLPVLDLGSMPLLTHLPNICNHWHNLDMKNTLINFFGAKYYS